MPTSPTPATALPTAPSRADPANFATRADAFLGALDTFRAQLNAIATNTFNNAVEADQYATAADSHRVAAAGSASAAAASALAAVNAPGSGGTSTTSLTIGTGAKTFATQTGKAWTVGQWVIAANSAAAANWMLGYITAYNSGTGSLTLEVVNTSGSGTYATWNLALSAPSSDAVPLAQLLAQLQYVIDIGGLTARMATEARNSLATYPTDLATYDTVLDRVVWQLALLHDLVGVTARAISGGDIILRRGTAGDPSLHFDADMTTGLYSPGAGAVALAILGQAAWTVTSDRRLGIGTATPTGLLDVNDNKVRVRTAQTPASSGAAGNAGDICWDANYIYVCTATNTWKRVAIAW